MAGKNKIAIFKGQKIRRVWDDTNEKWWFSVVAVVSVLTGSMDSGVYWRKEKIEREVAEIRE